MGERAAAFGGKVEVRTVRPHGTEVLAQFPLKC
jgi:signal transduction histidine kinase